MNRLVLPRTPEMPYLIGMIHLAALPGAPLRPGVGSSQPTGAGGGEDRRERVKRERWVAERERGKGCSNPIRQGGACQPVKGEMRVCMCVCV